MKSHFRCFFKEHENEPEKYGLDLVAGGPEDAAIQFAQHAWEAFGMKNFIGDTWENERSIVAMNVDALVPQHQKSVCIYNIRVETEIKLKPELGYRPVNIVTYRSAREGKTHPGKLWQSI